MPQFVDESYQAGAYLYVVAAAGVVGDLPEIRLTLKQALPKRVPRFHWRNESEASRQQMLERIVELGVVGRAYVGRNVAKQERARTQCLERLLWDMKERAEDEMVFETRRRHGDQRDRMTIIRSQKRGAASERLHYTFSQPGEEPLLWLADALAGAVSATLAGRGDYIDLLPSEHLMVIEVDP